MRCSYCYYFRALIVAMARGFPEWANAQVPEHSCCEKATLN